MPLDPVRILPGSKLVWVCPDHPDVAADQPGTCPKDGQALHYKVVSEATVLGESFLCPMHPERPLDKAAPCPNCGTVEKRMEYEKHLAVPVSAIVDSGERKVAFIDRGRGIFDMVEVQVGPRAGAYFPVMKGLVAGDRVATRGAFLLDAEARLDPAAATQYFGAKDHAGHRR